MREVMLSNDLTVEKLCFMERDSEDDLQNLWALGALIWNKEVLVSKPEDVTRLGEKSTLEHL